MKQCTHCKESKEDSEFYVIKRPPPRQPTLYRHCKECCKAVQKKNRDYSRNWELQKEYGITLTEYTEQCSKRNNTCDICHKEAKLHVDHSHVTGKVRGYLCGSCNRGIGLLQDKAELCYSAHLYLKGYS